MAWWAEFDTQNAGKLTLEDLETGLRAKLGESEVDGISDLIGRAFAYAKMKGSIEENGPGSAGQLPNEE